MAKKRIEISERTLFTCLAILGLALLFVPQTATSKLQFAFVHVFSRPLGICRSLTRAAFSQQSSSEFVDKRQYLKLRNHLANNIQWLHQERQNVAKLSGLRSRSLWEGVCFVLADIIVDSTDLSQNELIINRGRDDGLTQGQFVICDHSVIGIVTDLDQRMACVQLLGDPRSKVAVKIGDLGLQGIMQGNGNGSASIELIPKEHRIEKGDIVYVQKKPGFLEVPMIAGTVTQCEPDDENPLLWKIAVEPASNAKDVKSVTVITMNSQQYNKAEDVIVLTQV
jgi:rod shape-determining protein MreC